MAPRGAKRCGAAAMWVAVALCLLLVDEALAAAKGMQCMGHCTQSRNSNFELTLPNSQSAGVATVPMHYFNGYFSVRMKLPAGDSGGTLTSFYLIDTVTKTSKDWNHAEIDIEFYGGKTSRDIMMATNLFAQGKHKLAQFRLPFDPALEFHTYSIQWNNDFIAWFVDYRPFRIEYRRKGDPWPTTPMQPYVTIWDTSSWTQLKANYKSGPYKAWFNSYHGVGCASSSWTPRKGCKYWNTARLPWNRRLTWRQINMNRYWFNKQKINAWPWTVTK